MESEIRSTASIASFAVLGSRILLASIIRVATLPLRWLNWNGAPTVFKDVVFTTLRAMLQYMTIAESRVIFKGTTETYYDLCKETKQKPKSLTLDSVTAHWIGESDAEVVVVHLHGGGYTQPCSLGHMQYLDCLVKDLNQALGPKKISTLLPAYTLVPEARFPTQLAQAATVLSHLLDTEKRDPSNIILTGDSAGGGLLLSLLSHILHPLDGVPRVPPSSPFRGIVLYSPWVSYSTLFPSYTKNASKDALEASMLRKWGALYVGTSTGETAVAQTSGGDAYNEALTADPSWWQHASKAVDSVFIWAGANEIFLDSVREFAEKFVEGWGMSGEKKKVRVLVGEEEAHIAPIMDVMLQYEGKGQSQKAIEEWLKERLR